MTLRDVAARAGVSTSTVARVVHGNGYVAPDTRERVERAMREGGFRLNAVAAGLKRRRTTTIGAVLHETLPNPFYAEVALGIERGARERGYDVLIANAGGSADHERAGVEAFLSQQVAAIVFARPVDADNVALAHRAGTAVVEVEWPLFGGGGRVLVDDRAGAYAAVEHLLALGHERIGYLGEPTPAPPPVARAPAAVRAGRLGGWREALAARGAEGAEALAVVDEYTRDAGWPTLRTGRDYLARLLDREPAVTAVLAGSDLLAAGALQELYARRIRVPEQFSVIGFDDTYAQHLAPPLTTVRQPMFEMGLRAVELATALAAAPRRRTREALLRAELVVRDSTAAAPPR